jgi:glycerol-3-phosphate dehydrogenase subunit B
MESNRFDVVVVGAGLAGLTATAVAIERGQRVALVATGAGRFVLTPVCISTQELETLRETADLAPALEFFQNFAAAAGCAFDGSLTEERLLPTLTGGFESIAYAPRWLMRSTLPLEGPVAIAGIEGLSGFDAEFLVELLNMQTAAVGMKTTFVARTLWLDQPSATPPTTLRLANRFEREAGFSARLAAELQTAAEGCTRLLLPGILGPHSSDTELERLEREAHCSLGELTTLPPSIPGLRFYNRLLDHLQQRGLRHFTGFPVEQLIVKHQRCNEVRIASPGRPFVLQGESVVMATSHGAHALLSAHAEAMEARNLFTALSQTSDHNTTQHHAKEILAGYRAGLAASAQREEYAAR